MQAIEEKLVPPHSLADVTPRDMLSVGGPVYDPPYDTPLEDELAWHLVKYLNRRAALFSQVRVPTPCGVFWVDFVLLHEGRRVALECGTMEGVEDEQQQQYRDALIMGSGMFDVLYRVRGRDLFYFMEDVVQVLAKAHPAYFTARAQINLSRLAAPEVAAYEVPRTGMVLAVPHGCPAPDGGDATLRMKRLRLHCATDWVRHHDDALAHYGLPERYARSA